MLQLLLHIVLIGISSQQFAAAQVQNTEEAQLLTRFGFEQYHGGVVIIKAKLNNYPDSLNFILDTGSGGISLDSMTVEELSIPVEASDRTIRGIAGVQKVRFLYNGILHIPGLSTDSLNFHVIDYEILSHVYGFKIDGIIGFSLFSRYIIDINYDDNVMSVYSKGKFKYPKKGHIFKILPTNIPIIDIGIKDNHTFKTRYYFDTGAGLNLLLSERFMKDSSVLKSKRKLYATNAEGLGGKTTMHLTVVKRAKVGPFAFKNVPTHVFDDENNITAYPYLSGLVGNDLLRRFNLVLNYALREIYLTPNKHFRTPFDYAYTGMAIYFIDGVIVIDEVTENSPASRAGLKKGDVLLSVDLNFSGSIQEYKTLLQQTKRRIPLLISRNGELMSITLKPDSIL